MPMFITNGTPMTPMNSSVLGIRKIAYDVRPDRRLGRPDRAEAGADRGTRTEDRVALAGEVMKEPFAEDRRQVGRINPRRDHAVNRRSIA
jgi:hypothetical protein